MYCSICRLKPIAFVVISAFVCSGDDSPASANDTSPLAPQQTLEHFQLAPGLRIELAASEPAVIDPVAVRFDERGRMWLVEMRDYPHGPGEGEEPRSTIKVLEDCDGDGVFETATVFADKLLFVTGVQPWRGGVFVTMAGEVAYMKDTDGDGKADQRETWYTGFAEENPQLRANHPRLGLDNYIYIANGLRGGAVVDARSPDKKPLSISGMDFRFDPLTRKFEAVSGVGQFGLTFDDWGNRFVCSNRNPLKHIAIENRYLEKNPLAKIPAVAHDVAKSGADSHIFPIGRAWTTSNLHAGQFTAACGVHIYRGDALPSEFYGNAFVCDPTGYLVHREIVRPDGATFTSQPARNGIEFLASRDEWFRPVNLETGPDGALYVVDMYRAVIEHPQFMPAELKTRPDLLDGSDRGRIYRIVPADRDAIRKPASIAGATTKKLTDLLSHPNAWHRETAARLLLERQDKSVQDSLRALVTNGKSQQARIHALWLLRGIGVETDEDVRNALKNNDPQVRRQAVRMAERWLNEDQELSSKVAALGNDPHPAVRFQAALSVAPLPSAKSEFIHPIYNIAKQGIDDVWTRRAVTIAAGEHASTLAECFVVDPQFAAKPGAMALVTELYAAAGRVRNEQNLIATLEMLSQDRGNPLARLQCLSLTAFGQSLLGQGKSIWLYEDRLNPECRRNLRLHLGRAAEVARDNELPDDLRREAIALLELGNDAQLLGQIAKNDRSQVVRVAAINALRRFTDIEPWRNLLAGFASESPLVRGPILDGMLARAERTRLLLDAIEAGKIKAAELDRTRTNRLLKHGQEEIKKRAAALLASAIPADRKKVLADYQVALTIEADPHRGLMVFRKNCSSCHRVGNVGVNVAPDISDSRTKEPAQLLTDILQPNRAIDANYIGYSVMAVDGRVLTGILASETSTSITLRQAEGKELTLLRSEIEQLRSSGQSLMPVGLERDISHQQMADLISFIKNWRYLDSRTPLGE